MHVCMHMSMYTCISHVFVFAQYECMLTLHVGRQSKIVEKETDCRYSYQNIESGASSIHSHFSCLH